MMRRRLLRTALLVVATLVLAEIAASCTSNGKESCADLRHDLDQLRAETATSMRAWNDIEELQVKVATAERLRARIASECG